VHRQAQIVEYSRAIQVGFEGMHTYGGWTRTAFLDEHNTCRGTARLCSMIHLCEPSTAGLCCWEALDAVVSDHLTSHIEHMLPSWPFQGTIVLYCQWGCSTAVHVADCDGTAQCPTLHVADYKHEHFFRHARGDSPVSCCQSRSACQLLLQRCRPAPKAVLQCC
jgi:hypothetical protein